MIIIKKYSHSQDKHYLSTCQCEEHNEEEKFEISVRYSTTRIFIQIAATTATAATSTTTNQSHSTHTGRKSSVQNLRTHLVCAVFSLLLLFFLSLFWSFFRWFFAVYVFFIVYCLFSSGWSRNDDGRFTKEFKRNNIACSANERRKVKVNNVMSIILSGVFFLFFFFFIVRFSECSSNANENNNRRRDGKTLSWMNKRREWRRPTENLQWQSGIVCMVYTPPSVAPSSALPLPRTPTLVYIVFECWIK